MKKTILIFLLLFPMLFSGFVLADSPAKMMASIDEGYILSETMQKSKGIDIYCLH